MKKVNVIFVSFCFAIAASVLIFFGCSKKRITKTTLIAYEQPYGYLYSKQVAEQDFKIDSAGTGPIVGNQGTKIWTGKKCLMMPNGDTVKYPFHVKLVELYTPKDMIYYDMLTMASGNVLETSGEIRLRAFKDTTELVLKKGGCYATVEFLNPAPKSNYMRVFYGYSPAAGYFDFSDDPATAGAATGLNPIFSTTTTPSGYIGSIGKLGWINCGTKVSLASSSVLTFTSSVDDLTNVAIFVYLPATRSVIQAYNLSTVQIPNGSSAKIVAIAIDTNNQLYSFSQNLTVSAAQQISITMSATTDADLTALLDGL